MSDPAVGKIGGLGTKSAPGSRTTGTPEATERSGASAARPTPTT